MNYYHLKYHVNVYGFVNEWYFNTDLVNENAIFHAIDEIYEGDWLEAKRELDKGNLLLFYSKEPVSQLANYITVPLSKDYVDKQIKELFKEPETYGIQENMEFTKSIISIHKVHHCDTNEEWKKPGIKDWENLTGYKRPSFCPECSKMTNDMVAAHVMIEGSREVYVTPTCRECNSQDAGQKKEHNSFYTIKKYVIPLNDF